MKTQPKIEKYEVSGNLIDCEIHTVQSMDNNYIEIPIDDDVAFYGMITDNNAMCYMNVESCSGSFFINFYEFTSRSKFNKLLHCLLLVTNNLYCKSLYRNSSSNTVHMSYTHVSDILLSRELIDNCKFIIYKYTNTNENRTFYAVGMKNKKRKDPIFSKCNIRTSLCEATSPSVSQSWEQTIIEMECSPTSSTCVEIEKCEILDFEPRQVRVPSKSMRDNKNCYNTIALDSDDSTFFSYQVGNMRGSEYANFETKEFGKVFNLRSKTCGSMEEINIYTKKLIESYRSIFGSLCTTATILYTKVDDNKYVTSIAVYEKILPHDISNVEEDIF